MKENAKAVLVGCHILMTRPDKHAKQKENAEVEFYDVIEQNASPYIQTIST
jgi:hypothetical protein